VLARQQREDGVMLAIMPRGQYNCFILPIHESL
jgi:hypothetical protein